MFFALLLAAVLATSPVLAGDGAAEPAATAAEHVRISGEMKRLVERSQWGGVDRLYEELVALPGVAPSYDDHWRGVLAGQNLGDVQATAQRLQAALDADTTDEAMDAWAMFNALYGQVDIRVGKKATCAAPPLSMAQIPFEPTQRNALDAANEALTEARRFQGYLPVGVYSVCGTDFDIVGGPRVRVKAR